MKDPKVTGIDPKEILKSGEGKFSEDGKELLKQIVVHEAYSAAYKLKLASVVMAKGAKIVGAAAVKGGKALQKQVNAYNAHQMEKKMKK